MSYLETASDQKPEDPKVLSRLQRIQALYSKEKRQHKAYAYVYDCLVKNQDILDEFNVRLSKPNYLAKEIIGKMLGVSDSTITNILYRKAQKKTVSPA